MDVVWVILYVTVYWWGAPLLELVPFSGDEFLMGSVVLAALGSFPSVLSQIMTGILLGDGSLVKKYVGGGTYLKHAQGLVHWPYLLHLFKVFKDAGLVRMDDPSWGKDIGPQGQIYHWAQFSTVSLISWNSLYTLWYPNGVKVVPSNIFDLLTPIAMAYWFMDDGGWTGKGIHINTNGFTTADVQRLADVLSSKYGLKCSVHSRNRVYIWAQSAPAFIDIIRPHMHHSMQAKLSPSVLTRRYSSIMSFFY